MSRRGVATIAFVLPAVLCLMGLARDAGAEIVLRERFPVEGSAGNVIVQDENGIPVNGAEVSVIYRPGSSVESSHVIGTSSEGGQVSWTPQTAGIATLTATWTNEDGTETSVTANVSVKFSSAPVSGVIIMILAGLLLVGGSLWRIGRVLAS